MHSDFEELQIDGSFIREISLAPSQTIRLSVLRAPQNEQEKQVSTQYDLSFKGIRTCRFEFDARPWLEIRTHKAFLSSEYLDRYQEAQQREISSSEDQSGLGHFQFLLDEGQIDIIAEHFTSAIDNEIPHRGSALL